MIRIVDATDRAALAGLYRGGWAPSEALSASVRDILAAVRARGDEALLEYTRRWDDPNATRATLRVPIPTLADARTLIPREIADGLTLARDRIAAFHEAQRAHDLRLRENE